MLTNPDDEADVFREACLLIGSVARGRGIGCKYTVVVKRTDAREATGSCRFGAPGPSAATITLSVPKGASVPQVLALICHEAAHMFEPGAHDMAWRKAFAEGLALYGVRLNRLDGTKEDVHERARKALAERLGLPQASAEDPVPDGPKVGTIDPHKRDRVLRKVAQCLAVAANAGSEHEASTAALIASRLLQAYRLTMEDVTKAERDSGDPIVRLVVKHGVTRRVAWRLHLGSGLARVLGCFALGNSKTMHVHGRESAVLVFEHLYVYLLREIDRIGREATRAYSREHKRLGWHLPRDFFLKSEVLAAFRRNPGFSMSQAGVCRYCKGLAHDGLCEEPAAYVRAARIIFGPVAVDARAAEHRRYAATPKVWGAAFRRGAAAGVVARIQEGRDADEREAAARAASDCNVTALDLVNRDYEEAKKYAYAVRNGFIRYSRDFSGGTGSRDAKAAGSAAGRTIRIDRAIAATGDDTRRLSQGVPTTPPAP